MFSSFCLLYKISIYTLIKGNEITFDNQMQDSPQLEQEVFASKTNKEVDNFHLLQMATFINDFFTNKSMKIKLIHKPTNEVFNMQVDWNPIKEGGYIYAYSYLHLVNLKIQNYEYELKIIQDQKKQEAHPLVNKILTHIKNNSHSVKSIYCLLDEEIAKKNISVSSYDEDHIEIIINSSNYKILIYFKDKKITIIKFFLSNNTDPVTEIEVIECP